ncbi:MAG: dTDP-4-dehydrorhamnose reductase [Bdellovibrionales bacterium]
MTQQRVLLLGSSGQMGQTLQHLMAHKEIPATWDLTCISRAECDVTNPSQLRDVMQKAKPELVINAAALTNVEQAEKDENAAMAVNFHAVAQMAGQCVALDAPIIHLSTDYVFDGSEHAPYTPDDKMNPLNTFGASKMMGEEALRHQHPWHVILRVSSVFSPFRRNLLTAGLKMIEERDELRIATDLVTTPTYALDVGRAIISIGNELLLGKADGYGTFHLSGTPQASRYDFFEELLKAYEPYTTRRPKLTATVCAEFPDSVRRPPYSLLDCEKITRIYGIEPRSWKEGLAESLTLLQHAGRTPRLPTK